MRVLLAQINPTVGDIAGNTDKIVSCIASAKKSGCSLVVFPEMCLSGYPPEDLLLLPHFIEAIDHALTTVIRATQGIAAVVGTVRRHPDRKEKSLYNTAAVLENGALLGFQDKALLPTYDVFDERRFFQPSTGTQLWTIAGKHIGITICEDIWEHSSLLKYARYERDPVKEIASLHPDFVINLSASPFSMGKFNKRLNVCAQAAKTFESPLLFCNQVGGNDSLIFDG
ncbi:MAG: nitrilase-related carbon-nitrogen hydrolase, partial [Parachlamydiaceae bacterium]